MSYQPPQVLFWVLLLIAIGSALYLSYRSYKGTTDKTEKGLVISRRLATILENIEKRDLQLKDATVKQYKSLFSLTEFVALCDSIASARTEHAELLKNVKREVRGKKLKQDKIKRRQQMDDLCEKLSSINEGEWKLERLTAYGNELDAFPKMQNSRYEGIKAKRGKDKRWQKLFASLSSLRMEYPEYFTENELENMVNEYIDWSFGGSSICFSVELVNWYVSVDIQPTAYIDTGTYTPYVEIRNRMVRLREDISNKVKELATKSDRERRIMSEVNGRSSK